MSEEAEGVVRGPSSTAIVGSECSESHHGQYGVSSSIGTSVPAVPAGSLVRWESSVPFWSAIGVAASRIGSAAVQIFRGNDGRQDVSATVDPVGSRCSTEVDVLDVHVDSPFLASPCSGISGTPVPLSPDRSERGSLVLPTAATYRSGTLSPSPLLTGHVKQSSPVHGFGDQTRHEKQSLLRGSPGCLRDSLGSPSSHEPRLTRRAQSSNQFAIMIGSGIPKVSGSSEAEQTIKATQFSGEPGAGSFTCGGVSPGVVVPHFPVSGIPGSVTPHVTGDPSVSRSRSLAQRSTARSQTVTAGRSSSFVAPWQHRKVTGDVGQTQEPVREIIRRRLRANSSASVSTHVSSRPLSPGVETLSQYGSTRAPFGAAPSSLARATKDIVAPSQAAGAAGERDVPASRRASERDEPSSPVPLMQVVANTWASQAPPSPFQPRTRGFSSARSSFSERRVPAASLSRRNSEVQRAAPVRRWGSLPLPTERTVAYQGTSLPSSARFLARGGEFADTLQAVTSSLNTSRSRVADKSADMWLFSPTASQSSAKAMGDEGNDCDPGNRRSAAPPLAVHHLETESEHADDGTTAIATASPAIPDSPVHWLSGTDRPTNVEREPFTLPPQEEEREPPHPTQEGSNEDAARLLLQRLKEVVYPGIVVAHDERPRVVFNISPNFQPELLVRRSNAASIQIYTDLPMPVHEAFERPPPRPVPAAVEERESARGRGSTLGEGVPDVLKKWLLGESRGSDASTSAGSSREGVAVFEGNADDQEWLWESTVPSVVFHQDCKRDTMKSSGGSDKVYRPYVIVEVTSEWFPSVSLSYVPLDEPGSGGRDARVEAARSSAKRGKPMEGPGICIWGPHKPETLDTRL